MAKIVKHLTDTEIKQAKPKEKDYKLSDGQGLYFVVKQNGTKFFRFDFAFGGKRKSMSFGIYPTISLKEAREKREVARNEIQNNINPINQKKVEKVKETLTLEYVSEEWLKLVSKKLDDTTIYNYRGTLKRNVWVHLGKVEVKNIKRIDIVNLLSRMSHMPSSIKRIYALLGRIFSYAVINYNLKYNPVDFSIIDIFPKEEIKNHTAITTKDEIKELIQKINNLSIEDKEYYHYSAVYAIKILPYIFVRISSLLKAEWDHIDFEFETWLFPAENTKTKKDYLYPMPKQVVDLLLDLNEHIEESKIRSKYIFHSAFNNPNNPLSRSTVRRYLSHELGYKGQMTLHGFRSTFSTTAYENEELHGYGSFIIESCLSHADKNKIRSAYNRDSLTKYIKQKRELIQWYADYIDGL